MARENWRERAERVSAQTAKVQTEVRKLYALGKDAEAAALGAKVAKIAELEQEVVENMRKRDLIIELVTIDACGDVYAFSERRRFAGEELLLRDGISAVAFTPSRRLRYMLSIGRRFADKKPVQFSDVLRYCEERYNGLGRAEEDDVNSNYTAERLFQAARWAESGGNQFEITPNLAAALALTEVPEGADDWQLPYPVFAVSIPSDIVPFFVPGEDGVTRAEWADTLWVEESLTRSESANAGEDAGAKELIWTIRRRHAQVHQAMTVDREWITAEGTGVVPDDQLSFDAARRLVRNLLLWLNAEGGVKAHKPETVSPKLAEKRRRGGEDWPRHWIFGKEVELAPELRRAAAEHALGRSARHEVEGWRVRARFTVRGHWRNQACGPGKALRRRQWITPHWKGPPEKEAWAHIYKTGARRG